MAKYENHDPATQFHRSFTPKTSDKKGIPVLKPVLYLEIPREIPVESSKMDREGTIAAECIR